MTRNEIEKYHKDKAACDALRPIRRTIAYRMGIRDRDWCGRKNPANLVRAREIVAYIARDKFGMTYELMSIACGWKHKSSARDAYERVISDPERVSECEAAWREAGGGLA